MAKLAAAMAMDWKQLSKLVSRGHYQEALHYYSQARAARRPPDRFHFPCLLKSCANLQAVSATLHMHAHLTKSGFASDPYTATALTHAYAKLLLFEDARKVLDEMPERELPCFNALIAGFSQCREFAQSRRMLTLLVKDGLLPNSVTVASALPACRAVKQGEQLHGLAVKAGHDLSSYVVTALITMYSACWDLGSARTVLALAVDKSVESYNAMASGFLSSGSHSMALDLVREMIIGSGKQPNSTTLLAVLSACSDMLALSIGKQAHCYLLKHEMARHVMLGTTLIDMYCKCSSPEWAYRVFAGMEERSLVTWNAMISGFLIHGDVGNALELFKKLRSKGFEPDTITWNLMISGLSHHREFAEVFSFFGKMQSKGASRPSLESMTSMLHACSAMSDLRHGKEVYGHVIRTREDFGDEVFQTMAIHMFMSCGYHAHAGRIFEKYGRKSGDPAMWNAMISGYGRSGEENLALKFFGDMFEQQVKPSSATFLSALSACRHAGLVEEGMRIYQMMSKTYSFNPGVDHRSCLVDLLGRAGKLSEACELLLEHPNPPTSMWHSFLGACRNYSDAKLGEMAAKRLLDLDPTSTTPLVTMSNIYAEQERWNEVERLRGMLDRVPFKEPGCSKMT